LGNKSPAYLPSHRGYDRYFGYYSGVMDYFTHAQHASLKNGKVVNGGLDLHLGGADFNDGKWPPNKLDEPVYGSSGSFDTGVNYSTPMFAEKASQWIEEHGRNKPEVPMFLYLAWQGCHSGDNSFVQATAPGIARFEAISPNATCDPWDNPQHGQCTKTAMRKSVAACMAAVDAGIGVVMAALKRAEMMDNSLVVLSTDNGGPTDGADNNMMNNFPLRGCKGGYFEGGVRGVGLIHGMGLGGMHGVVSNEMHHVNDWLPTLLTAATALKTGNPDARHTIKLGYTEPPLLMGDGIDNWKMLATAHLGPGAAKSARTEMIHVTQASGSVLEAEALRVGHLKLVWHPAGTDCSRSHPGWYPPPGKKPTYATFTVKCPPPPPVSEMDACTQAKPCLFNISADPCEHKNLATALPAQLTQLKARLAQYRATAILSWLNFPHELDPASKPSHFGPVGEYDGVVAPWLSDAAATAFYPSNYSGPGAPQ
jgi:hypothetical protein